MKEIATREQILNEMRRLLNYPCAQCGRRAEAVGAFRPAHPERFGMRPDDDKALFFPCCRKCADKGFDLEFIELDAMSTFGLPMV